MSGLFITGTDTGVGKSWVAAGMMAALQQQGRQVVGMKPVASGAVMTAAGLRNEDALLLQQQGSLPIDYALINPYTFAAPIAPHLAAAALGEEILLAPILASYQQLAAQAEMVVVEGVGGWRVPLSEAMDVAQLAQALQLPVVLVVGMRLGCINQALLTADAIIASGVAFAGWVATTLEPAMALFEGNVATLQQRLPVPLLGVVPHLQQLDVAAVAAAFSRV